MLLKFLLFMHNLAQFRCLRRKARPFALAAIPRAQTPQCRLCYRGFEVRLAPRLAPQYSGSVAD